MTKKIDANKSAKVQNPSKPTITEQKKSKKVSKNEIVEESKEKIQAKLKIEASSGYSIKSLDSIDVKSRSAFSEKKLIKQKIREKSTKQQKNNDFKDASIMA